jgi:hypothetical protein
MAQPPRKPSRRFETREYELEGGGWMPAFRAFTATEAGEQYQDFQLACDQPFKTQGEAAAFSQAQGNFWLDQVTNG